ncbi:MAG: SRPBCC family protein [Euryarchaeota archaeon]|nr:SRPBCC family protein [Euryarchaeota archaeon]
MHRISASVVVRAPPEKVREVVADLEKRFRLHPAWHVLSFERLGGGRFRVRVRKESGEERELRLEVVAEGGDRISYRDEGGDLEVELLLEEVEQGVRLTQTERFTLPWEPSEKTLRGMEEELRFWLEAIKHYCELRDNPVARTSKFIIDNFLLRLPPQQRRIVFLIIILNAGILILFILTFAGMKLARLLLNF